MAIQRRGPVPPRIDLRSKISDPNEWAHGGKWVLVKSSNVHAIAYSDVKRWLYVKFGGKRLKKGGVSPISTYIYHDVPTEVAKAMFTAASLGKFVWSDLRDKYKYQRLD